MGVTGPCEPFCSQQPNPPFTGTGPTTPIQNATDGFSICVSARQIEAGRRGSRKRQTEERTFSAASSVLRACLASTASEGKGPPRLRVSTVWYVSFACRGWHLMSHILLVRCFGVLLRTQHVKHGISFGNERVPDTHCAAADVGVLPVERCVHSRPLLRVGRVPVRGHAAGRRKVAQDGCRLRQAKVTVLSFM